MKIEGKTKIVESLDDPQKLRITTKDSLTANDPAIQADLPVAGDKTTQTIQVYHFLKKNGVPVAYITRNSDTSFIAWHCKMLPIECVIRRQPYGSYIKRHPEVGSSDIFNPPKTEFYHKHAVVVHPETTQMMPEETARSLYLKDGEWTGEVYTDPLIEPHEDSWLLYPAKLPRHEMQPLMDILPVVDMETLEHIRTKLMLPCFELLEKAWKKFDVNLIDMKIEVITVLQLFFGMPIFWVGISLFGYFAYTAPEDCPKKYMKIVSKGGVLQNAGDIHKYCKMTLIGRRYHYTLREDVRVTFDDILKKENGK